MADYRDIWSPAKIFSPTTTRHQVQLAKDWAYIDTWLSTRHPGPLPPFERNPTTLKALLALAAANESADEERALEKSVKQKTLTALQKLDPGGGDSVVAALEERLTPDGTRALNSIALLSVALGCTSTSPRRLAEGLVDLSRCEFGIARETARVEGVRRGLQRELEGLRVRLRRVESGGEYKVPAELAGQAAEWMRTTRHLQRKTEDYEERVEALEVGLP